MCLNPKWIYKSGYYKDNNYRGAAGDFYEIGTYSKCGACEQCNAEKANNWVVRNYYEAKRHKKISFITLTYKENPIILVKKDLQDFMKRLRRHLEYKMDKKYGFTSLLKKTEIGKRLRKEKYEEIKLRMFGAGEYGSKKNRPHMHILLYNYDDMEKRYLDVNKKGNVLLTSPEIEKIWGLGRTTFQEFDVHEIPYLSLYETPKEQFKKAYKLTKEKVKQIENLAYNNRGMKKAQKKNLLKELAELEKQMEKEKQKYIAVKEFNTWSIALGWEQFYEEYSKCNDYVFTEYIEDCEYPTPTPWVKKLANMGDILAAEEMYRREQEYKEISPTEEAERDKNLIKLMKRRKKELLDWNEQKDQIEDF